MNRKTLNTILTIAGTGLGIAGLALILISSLHTGQRSLPDKKAVHKNGKRY